MPIIIPAPYVEYRVLQEDISLVDASNVKDIVLAWKDYQEVRLIGKINPILATLTVFEGTIKTTISSGGAPTERCMYQAQRNNAGVFGGSTTEFFKFSAQRQAAFNEENTLHFDITIRDMKGYSGGKEVEGTFYQFATSAVANMVVGFCKGQILSNSGVINGLRFTLAASIQFGANSKLHAYYKPKAYGV